MGNYIDICNATTTLCMTVTLCGDNGQTHEGRLPVDRHRSRKICGSSWRHPGTCSLLHHLSSGRESKDVSLRCCHEHCSDMSDQITLHTEDVSVFEDTSPTFAELKKRFSDLLKDSKDVSKLASQLDPLFVSLHDILSQDREIPLDVLVPVVRGKDLVPLLKLLRKTRLDTPAGEGLYILCQYSLSNMYDSTSYLYSILLNLILGRTFNAQLLRLVSSSKSILVPFLCETVTCIRLHSSREISSAHHILDLLFHIFQYSQNLFDIELVDYLVQSLHNYIINTECKNMPLLKKTLQLYIKIGNYSYQQGNLVTSSNIDKILQFQIFLGHFDVRDYAPALQGKDATWTENSLLSLECLVYPDLADISFSTPSQNIDWSSVISYLDLIVLILENSDGLNIKKTFLRPLFSLLLKLCKIINIPIEYNVRFKVFLSKILQFAYINDLRPYENLKFFLLLLSYVSFSAEAEVRKNAYLALNALLSLDDDIVAPYFNSAGPQNFNKICLDCISGYDNEKNHVYIIKNLFEKTQSKFLDFNFDELFYTTILFQNLDIIRNYTFALGKYPKSLRVICEDHLKKSSFLLTLDSKRLNLIKLVINRKTSIHNFGSFRMSTIPLYPGATKEETRIYLFVLSSLTEKKKLDMNDFMICDMFRYNDPDIISCLASIFEKYNIIDTILTKLIESLGDQNLVLLSVVESSPKLFQTINNSAERFHIIKACLFGDSQHFLGFLEFFAKLIKSCVTAKETRPLYNLLKTVEKTYLDWESEDRILFWNELTKYSTDGFLQKSFTGTLNDFTRSLKNDERYLILNQQMAIPLTIDDFGNKTSEELKDIISEKIASHKLARKAHSKSKKPQSLNKTKRMPGEEIIKVHHLPLDKSEEEIQISITVYPNGRYNEETFEKTKIDSTKKLSKKDRKLLFLRNLPADKSGKMIVQGKPIVITKYFSHFVKTMISDLFKGVFQGKSSIGNFVAHLFNSDVNFISASDERIQQILKDFNLKQDEITNYLFVKLVFYLASRNLMDAVLRKKLKIIKSKGGDLHEFIEEEFKVSQKS